MSSTTKQRHDSSCLVVLYRNSWSPIFHGDLVSLLKQTIVVFKQAMLLHILT